MTGFLPSHRPANTKVFFLDLENKAFISYSVEVLHDWPDREMLHCLGGKIPGIPQTDSKDLLGVI